MIEPQVQWVAPAPLWPGFARAEAEADRARLRRPDILRFATDSFMDEFMGTLAHQPERLHEWRAQPETWETPAPDPPPVVSLLPIVERIHRLREATGSTAIAATTVAVPTLGSTVNAGEALKLYQPGHQRFYLITACLVCRLPGLPDRVINSGNAEKAGYVIRRLRPKAGSTRAPDSFDLSTCDEYAFVDGKRWDKADEHDLVPGEEVLPLFGVTYVEHDGRRRRVLAGTIPVGKRETYIGAAVTPILPPDESKQDPVDPRKVIFQRKVADAWRAMVAQYDRYGDSISKSSPPPSPTDTAKFSRNTEDQANLLSWLILLDFADFLKRYVPGVWDVATGQASETSLDSDPKTLYDSLLNAHATDPHSGTSRSVVDALVSIVTWRDQLESAAVPYTTDPQAPNPPSAGTYPDFLFPLQSPTVRTLVETPTTLDDMVADALKSVALPDRTPALPLAATTSSLDFREPGWFIIRCVFDRPNCVPLTAPLLSEATDPFQMATFFDAEAPARPVRIALPLDITPAGLRKFDRNTAFLISDTLCKVLPSSSGGGLTFLDLVLSVLPWPLHKDLPSPPGGACADKSGISFGLICSISIPIITICALILLMIIVNLLDIIFHWIPYFIMCFPLPNFSSKRSS